MLFMTFGVYSIRLPLIDSVCINIHWFYDWASTSYFFINSSFSGQLIAIFQADRIVLLMQVESLRLQDHSSVVKYKTVLLRRLNLLGDIFLGEALQYDHVRQCRAQGFFMTPCYLIHFQTMCLETRPREEYFYLRITGRFLYFGENAQRLWIFFQFFHAQFRNFATNSII